MKTNNGQKYIGLLGLSFGNYISIEKLFAQSFSGGEKSYLKKTFQKIYTSRQSGLTGQLLPNDFFENGGCQLRTCWFLGYRFLFSEFALEALPNTLPDATPQKSPPMAGHIGLCFSRRVFFLYLFALELYRSVVWFPLGRASISTSYGIFFVTSTYDR